jgi:hypothetical protein
MTDDNMLTVVDVDSRGRVSLGRLRQEGTERYLAHVEHDGTIILQPAVVMSAAEARLLNDPALVARIKAGIDSDVRVDLDR